MNSSRTPCRSASLLALFLAGCPPAATDSGPNTDETLSDSGSDSGADSGDTAATEGWTPLFTASTPMARPVLEDDGSALITRFGDRGRDRHAREDVFAAYDHYLSHYWVHRTVAVEIVDTVGREENGSITFHVTSEFKLADDQAELRFFYRGLGTVAEYHNNGVMTPLDDLHYTRSVSVHGATGQPLQVGDHMEFELSQFLDRTVKDLGGRAAYYGTTYLYVVGTGLVPWQANTVLGSDTCPCDGEFSYPIPERGWLGGRTTLPYQYSNEPRDHFMQMATNLAGDNAQPFVLGRRLLHTRFGDGSHTENGYAGGDLVDNPPFTAQVGKLGPRYANRSCDDCHVQNTRALPPAVGASLDQYVVRVGDVTGAPSATLGHVLQSGDDLGASEGGVTLASWTEEEDLRRPVYAFSGPEPEAYSVRIAPQLVGMGLLEAIPEEAVAALADPDDEDGDGISGRMHLVDDPQTGDRRLGRFGYKASQARVHHQVASALNTDMGVMTSVFPDPDCGADQSDCAGGVELSDGDLDHLSTYVSLLGMRPQRDLDDPVVADGQARFSTLGCAACHLPTVQTSAFAEHAELRDQTIHPYTDLLLHDLGSGLADSLPEGDASGSEWRTAPLWGIGLTPQVSQGEGYLHDGRARTLDEAIRWHGGEAQAAKEAYEALSEPERAAVVTFLGSL
jgi:CxxC motif-containing protein (DUF1111 family)